MRLLYIMISPRYPYRHKIGIATNGETRRKSVKKSVGGAVWKIWAVVPPNAKKTEGLMHRIFAMWNAPIRKKGGKTNGETEWFITVNFITLFALWLFAPAYWWIAILPIPFDTIITITFIFLVAWSLRLLLLGIFFYILLIYLGI